MGLYFLHLRNGDELISDLEGYEFPDLEAARHEALNSAIELWCDFLKSRRDPSCCSFEIHDEAGRHLGTVPFSEVPTSLRGQAA